MSGPETTRHLYIARHGDADALGNLTESGRRQARLLGERLAAVPVDVVLHSPLPRAEASAHEIAAQLPDGTPVLESAELSDHVPYVPSPEEIPPALAGFFDGFDDAEAAVGQEMAASLIRRFGGASPSDRPAQRRVTHEVLVTHAFQIAWLIRHVMDAPPARWLGLNSANAALTVIEHRSKAPSAIVMVNEMSHLPRDLRWTGFPAAGRP